MNSSHCLNCQAPLHTPYCGQCGQSAKVHRFTLAGLLHDVPHAVFHVERGILPTLAGLLRRPGATINAYLDGQRTRFFNPLRAVSTMTFSALRLIMPIMGILMSTASW